MAYVEGAPDIQHYEDDLILQEDLAEFFGVASATIDKWRWGKDNNGNYNKPPMPFIRMGNRVYFSKHQITWWLNEYQRQPDAYRKDRMARLKEGKKVGRKSV